MNSKDNIDRYIRENDILRRFALTYEQAYTIVRRSMLNNGFAFIFADVVNSFMRDCEYDLDKFNKGFSQKTKENYKNMMKCIRGAVKWSQELTMPMYNNKEVDDLCHDADFWYALIRLIDDRIGTDPQKTHLLLEFILNMPKGDSPYNITLNDFK